MSIVRFQFAGEDRVALLEYARRWIWPGGPIGDSELHAWVLQDMAASLEEEIEASTRRHSEIVEGQWLMTSSYASLYPERRRPLGYQMMLQHWDPRFPDESDDVPMEVAGAPTWLDRVIVMAWAGIGAYR